MVLHVHHTFLSPAGGPNPGKRHFSVKKAPKIRFCAAISHPHCGYIDILDAFEGIAVYLECFWGDPVK